MIFDILFYHAMGKVVYFMENDKVAKSAINAFEVHIKIDGGRKTHTVFCKVIGEGEDLEEFWLDQEEVYSTQEGLLNSLKMPELTESKI